MNQKSMLAFKVIAGIACFAGFLTASSELSRSQSEKTAIRPAWIPGKQILPAAAIPLPPRTLPLEMTASAAKKTQPIIKSAYHGEAMPLRRQNRRHSPPLSPALPVPRSQDDGVVRGSKEPDLLDHTELQAMVNSLDYEVLPGKGVRFRYDEIRQDRLGHEWFLKSPSDLRGKSIQIDYLGFVPREMTFRIAKSGRSAAVIKKVKLVDSPNKPRSVFLDIPDTIPFREVQYLEFWFDRETAGRSHGDFMIGKVVEVPAS